MAIIVGLNEAPTRLCLPTKQVNFGNHVVLNSVDSGRRLMLRAALYPAGAVVVLALAMLALSPRHAAAALLAGLAAVLGGAVAAWVALGGGIQAAGPAVARLLLAMGFKWVLLIVALGAGLLAWHLPVVPMLAAIAVSLVFQALALARR